MSVGQVVRPLLSLGLGVLLALIVAVLLLRLRPYFSRAWGIVEEKTKIDVSDELKSAIIGGVVGGIAFAAVNPVIAPALYDAQVNTGLVQQPEPDISVRAMQNASVAEDAFREPVHDDYWLFFLSIRNPNQRLVRDFAASLMFGGQVEAVDRGPSRIIVGASNDLEFQSDYSGNRSTDFASVSVDELPPNRVGSATFLVDMDPEEDFTKSAIGVNTEGRRVAVSVAYNWQYNGRVYSGGQFLERRIARPVPQASSLNISRAAN